MTVTGKSLPIQEFKTWLPGELTYSARKAGYASKVDRASRDPEDRTSMHGFLGTEWHNYQNLWREGVLHIPGHAMSAQLQLAKFAAGLFDKAALGDWVLAGQPADEAEVVGIAEVRAAKILREEPWLQHEQDVRSLLTTPFESSVFSNGVKMIMKLITQAMPHVNSTHDFMKDGAIEDIERMTTNALLLGGQAVGCYELFAVENLADDQQAIPNSQLA